MFHRDVWKNSTQHWETDYIETCASRTKNLLNCAFAIRSASSCFPLRRKSLSEVERARLMTLLPP